ncbi:MAG: carbohydrate ABC transporter permease [Clostridiaceae bacterium]|nr:carbohydrate ABC transporter permease [Clostridiaceae bacterium]
MVKSKGDKFYDFSVNLMGILVSLLTFYPLYYILIASLSRPLGVDSGEVMIGIVKPTLEAYSRAFALPNLWVAYGNTFYYAFFGVFINMLLTTTMAFALSRKRLLGRKYITLLVVFTMWFNAGIIPTFMNFNSLNMLDTRAAIILGFGISAYNLIIMKSFFEAIPEEMEEAATVDGATSIRVFWQIYLPMSKPALATVVMFYLVNRWNGYFWPMTLLTDDMKMPLQVMLKKLIVDQVANETEAAIITSTSLWSPTTRIYALMVIAIVPMMLIYPLLQKYFQAGMTVGAVKG